MKFFSLFVLLIPLLHTACSNTTSPDKLIGTWQIAQNQQIKGVFKANNTYQLDMDGDGNTEIEGVYSIHGSRVAMSDLKGKSACDSELIGIYRFEITDDTLTFTPIAEGCDERKSNTSLRWVKLPGRMTAME